MKKYISHKIVDAAEIVGILLGVDLAPVTLQLSDGSKVPKPAGTNYSPQIGDYFVRYADGYESLSPKQAFEEGYSELKGSSAVER